MAISPELRLHQEARIKDERLTNDVLRREGYPALKDWSNEMVEYIFGECSNAHHRLVVILENTRDADDIAYLNDYVYHWSQAVSSKVQGCRSFNSFKEQGYGKSYTKHLCGTCPCCGEFLEFWFTASRLVFILKLPRKEYWKGVIKRRHHESYVFEGSGQCNIFGHPNHCMTPSHLSLETYQHNANRKSHHTGAKRCDCLKPCIGCRVRFATPPVANDAKLTSPSTIPTRMISTKFSVDLKGKSHDALKNNIQSFTDHLYQMARLGAGRAHFRVTYD